MKALFLIGAILAGAPEYRVGVGDVLQVTVPGPDEVSRSCRVQTSGTARFPVVGDVFVSGRSVVEIEGTLDSLLRREGVAGPAHVEIVDYESQAVTVVGAVDQPGRKPLRGRTGLVEVLVASGGLTRQASGEVVIVRADGRSMNISLRTPATMTAEALPDVDVPLESGDLISVSPKRYVTIEGDVTRPGVYAMEAEATLSWVVAKAGGLARAAARVVHVRRLGADGRPADLEIDIKAISRGEAHDVPLLPSDVITVKHRIF
jgi:polysaccharide biosynthesis/export protein